jgi:hypothetical protein
MWSARYGFPPDAWFEVGEVTSMLIDIFQAQARESTPSRGAPRYGLLLAGNAYRQCNNRAATSRSWDDIDLRRFVPPMEPGLLVCIVPCSAGSTGGCVLPA